MISSWCCKEILPALNNFLIFARGCQSSTDLGSQPAVSDSVAAMCIQSNGLSGFGTGCGILLAGKPVHETHERQSASSSCFSWHPNYMNSINSSPT